MNLDQSDQTRRVDGMTRNRLSTLTKMHLRIVSQKTLLPSFAGELVVYPDGLED